MKKWSPKRNTLRSRISRVNLLLIALFTLLAGGIFVYQMARVSREYDARCDEQFAQISAFLEDTLRAQYNYLYRLESDANIQDVLARKDVYEPRTQWALYRLLPTLKATVSADESVQGVFILLPKLERVLTENGTSRYEIYAKVTLSDGEAFSRVLAPFAGGVHEVGFETAVAKRGLEYNHDATRFGNLLVYKSNLLTAGLLTERAYFDRQLRYITTGSDARALVFTDAGALFAANFDDAASVDTESWREFDVPVFGLTIRYQGGTAAYARARASTVWLLLSGYLIFLLADLAIFARLRKQVILPVRTLLTRLGIGGEADACEYDLLEQVVCKLENNMRVINLLPATVEPEKALANLPLESGVYALLLVQTQSEAADERAAASLGQRLVYNITTSKGRVFVLACEGEEPERFAKEAYAAAAPAYAMIALSDAFRAPEEVPERFERVVNLLARSELGRHSGGLLVLGEDAPPGRSISFKHTIDVGQSLAERVLAGDSDGTRQRLEGILEANDFASCDAQRQLRGYLLDLLGILLSTCGERFEAAERDALAAQIQAARAQLDPRAVDGALAELCDALSRQCAKREKTQMDEICRYVEEHYAEDMSLELLADHFHIAPGYLSKLFKATLGVNYLDVLLNKRIRVAKELLATSDMTVNEIAAMLGYSNATTFIRLFKRYENVTPSQYRTDAQKIELG